MEFVCGFSCIFTFAGIYAGVVEKLAYLFNYEYGGN